MAATSYAIALGSNKPHGRHGSPAHVLKAAVAAMDGRGLCIRSVSRIRITPALGPAGRRFANAALILESDMPPPALLTLLKEIEREFGRRSAKRWGPRVLDLDILLWSGGRFKGQRLTIPHSEFRRRSFVLKPLAEIAPGWRDPVSGLTVRQLEARLHTGKVQ